MKKTPVYIITGFLGSGKTTLVKQLIEQNSGRKKVAVIQNEFSPAALDGQELKRQTNFDFDLLEINNGSVFCVCLLSGFISSLLKFIQQHSPEIILLESSGLSDPIAVGQIFNSPQLQEYVYLAGSVCIVDALNFKNLDKMMLRIKHQLIIADYIIINKTDLMEQYEEILLETEVVNPYAKKYFATYCNVPFNEILKPLDESVLQSYRLKDSGEKGAGRPEIQSVVFRSVKPLKYNNIERFLSEVTQNCYRLKGYIKTEDDKGYAVQAVFSDFNIQEIPVKVTQTELIAMGENISHEFFNGKYEYFNK